MCSGRKKRVSDVDAWNGPQRVEEVQVLGGELVASGME